ncbi:TolC family protein [Colwellia sp. Arc7-635]|nr:TolC family protein [Colwellia sp. Arc7-635]
MLESGLSKMSLIKWRCARHKFNALYPLSIVFYTNLMLMPCAFADTSITYVEAKTRLIQQSDAIQATEFDLASKQNIQASLAQLGFPTLSINAGYQSYSLQRELNIEPLQQVAGQFVAGSEQVIPSKIALDFKGTNPKASITSVWELYTGGRITAARIAASASVNESKAQQDGIFAQQEKLLATIYFSHLLAKQILMINKDVRDDVKRHLHLAKRFESTGILSKVERLHAQVAFDEANRSLEQAQADFEIAGLTLQRLLRSNEPVKPLTNLFVITKTLAPVSQFLNAGMTKHNQLAVLRAKHKQAEQAKVIEEARWKPTVAAYGSYNLARHDADFNDPLALLDPDWVVGINISYKIFDSTDRRHSVNAANLNVSKVDALRREFEMRLKTYIETSYRSVERARSQYMLLASNIELADETLTLRERLFSEGLGTSLDVIDALLSVAKVKTQQSAAAYDFVLSLVDLLEGSGQLQNFSRYINQADVSLAIEEKTL